MPMQVDVKLYAGLQQGKGAHKGVTLPEPACVADLLRALDLAEHDVELVAVNGELGQYDTPLHNGDKVSLMPFIGGG